MVDVVGKPSLEAVVSTCVDEEVVPKEVDEVPKDERGVEHEMNALVVKVPVWKSLAELGALTEKTVAPVSLDGPCASYVTLWSIGEGGPKGGG